MKMIGMRRPWDSNALCSSTPLILGICTSTIRQDECSTSADCKNAWADAKLCATCPSDLIRAVVAVRTDSSSSMIEINEPSDNCAILLLKGTPLRWGQPCPAAWRLLLLVVQGCADRRGC